jgi:ArsR family transcriptional regulator, arsenate/arsenite/antimonite-responsive transcriptional repressor
MEADVVADLAFEALADPVRREMLAVLAAHDECSASMIAERITSVGRTTVSAHLRVLKVAGLVTERRSGRYRYYAVDPSGSAREVLALLHQVFVVGRENGEARRA